MIDLIENCYGMYNIEGMTTIEGERLLESMLEEMCLDPKTDSHEEIIKALARRCDVRESEMALCWELTEIFEAA